MYLSRLAEAIGQCSLLNVARQKYCPGSEKNRAASRGIVSEN